jgi:hypothetical protein
MLHSFPYYTRPSLPGRPALIRIALVSLLSGFASTVTGITQGLPLVQGIELQPLAAQIRRVMETLDYLGAPLAENEKQALEVAFSNRDETAAIGEIQKTLDPHCLVAVHINPEMRVKVAVGAAPPVLSEQGWRTFLVKVHNEAGATAPLRVLSPNAQSIHNSPNSKTSSDRLLGEKGRREAGLAASDLWLDIEMFDKQPLKSALSGLLLEYQIVSLYSRDAGHREAKLAFDVGQGTQDLGFRSETDILFQCQPAREITFQVLDEKGAPAMAMFNVRDHQGRIYPSPAKRLAPDFAFHPQVYRADGEKLKLPDGDYTFNIHAAPSTWPRDRR